MLVGSGLLVGMWLLASKTFLAARARDALTSIDHKLTKVFFAAGTHTYISVFSTTNRVNVLTN